VSIISGQASKAAYRRALVTGTPKRSRTLNRPAPHSSKYFRWLPFIALISSTYRRLSSVRLLSRNSLMLGHGGLGFVG
jgi:hypothetical protein